MIYMYVRKNDKINSNELTQLWINEISTNATMSAKKINELKQNRVITEFDIQLIKTLYTFKVAPMTYLMKLMNDFNEDNMKSRLDKLIKFRILNGFMLHNGEEVTLKPDAEIFYTIDTGGITLLTLYTNEEHAMNFQLSSLVMTSGKLKKKLMMMDFYLELTRNVGSRLQCFFVDQPMSCNHNRYYPTAVFVVKGKSGEDTPFILESMRFDDYYTVGAERIQMKVDSCESIVATKAWKKYFSSAKPPVVLFLVDNLDAAKKVAEIADDSNIDGFRIVVASNFVNGLEKSFMKLKDGKLVATKTTIFSPTK